MENPEVAMRELASYSEQYQLEIFDELLGEFGLSRNNIIEADRCTALKFFYRLYGFNRQGAPRRYPHIAVSGVEDVAEGINLSSDELWTYFKKGCQKEDIGINPANTKGVIKDIVELVNREGNLFDWVQREVASSGRLTTPYTEVISAKGIGPKITRFFLRDAVWVADMESEVVQRDRHYIQPIDIWVRRTAETLWPRLSGDRISDEDISRRIADACETHGISNAEFNQGAWYFGAKEMQGDEERTRERIRNMSLCPECGKNVNFDEPVFCPYCGTEL